MENLIHAKSFKDVRLVRIFDRKLYELDVDILRTIDTLSLENVKYLYATDSDVLVQRIIDEIRDDDLVFFIREGDLIDPDYLEYVNCFFEYNHNYCDILFTPVVKPNDTMLPTNFIDLPDDGIKFLDSENSLDIVYCTKGVIFSGKLFKDDLLDTKKSIDIFVKIIIKAILKKKRYGIINTVRYISSEVPQKQFNPELLKELADYSLELYGELPPFMIECISQYIDKQLNNTMVDFDEDVFMLREFLPLKFEEIETHCCSLTILDVRNYYAEVEIEGMYVRPHWEKETKLTILPHNTVLLLYEERLADLAGWKQKIYFRAIVGLDCDSASIEFGINTSKNFRIIETVHFGNSEESITKINNYVVRCEINKVFIEKIAPRAFYKASCIIPIFNGEKYLEDALNSVISQSIGFLSNMQILLINNGSEDSTESICLEYVNKYPYNISYFYLEEQSVSKACNVGLQHAIGNYISFLDADNKLPSDYIEAGIDFLSSEEDIDLVAFPIRYFNEKSELSEPSINFKSYSTNEIDVKENPYCLQSDVYNTLIKKSAVSNLCFNEELSYSEGAEFIHKIILNKMKYGVAKNSCYLCRTGENNSLENQSKENWVSRYIKNTAFGKALVNYSQEMYGYVTQYTQTLLLHELTNRFFTETPENIAEQEEISFAINSISNSLQYVDDEIIKSLPRLKYWTKCTLLKLKHQEVSLRNYAATPEFYIGNSKFETLRPTIYITTMRERDDSILVSGYYNLPSYEGIKLGATYSDKFYYPDIIENCGKDIYFLGQKVHSAKVFDFDIPFNGEGDIDFFVEVEGSDRYPVKLEFLYMKYKEFSESFSIGKTFVITSTEQDNQIKLEFNSFELVNEIVIRNLKLFSKEITQGDKNLINEYLSMYPVLSKSKVWLFMDEVKNASGNAKDFFIFCSKIHDGIEKIFVIEKNSPDGTKLENYGTVVEYGSVRHKLLYLYAEKIIVSDLVDNKFNPFAKSALYPLYSNIVKAELIYLPNEPHLEDLSSVINRFTVDISLFATVSETERDFVLKNNYGYNENIVQTIGLPKYDKPLDLDRQQIIFIPFWREKLYQGENIFNFDFVNSEYCQKISELLCDERLFETLEEYGYEMCFVPHSKIFLQLADFDMYENVKIIPLDFPKHELFATASLLITDWSSVFEFAYMKKPIIYYQFAKKEAENHFGDNPKFGEMVSDNAELVDKIIEYIENGCVVGEEYEKRINEYFKYTDNENCQRIYDVLTKKKTGYNV